jgi:RNA polymerase sigma factor (TIGR02999 family)
MVRERGGHTWQPTSLVNELYLELIKINALPAREAGAAPERAAFFGLAAHLMRRLLIHHARPLASRVEKVEVPELPDHSNSLEVLAEIEDVLDRLGSIDAKLRTVVEAKVFEGLTTKEIAAHMGCGTATVERHWSFARRWLSQELGKTADT